MQHDLTKKHRLAEKTAQKIRKVRHITLIGLIVNILLSILKFIFGIVGSSQAVVADAVHSLSDMSTDIAILLGVKYWSAPADEEHPYGHWRIETMVTAAIGLTLAGVALGIGYNALITMQYYHSEQPGLIAFIGALISIIAKEILYRWTVVVGRKAKSSAVIANAWHHRSDALSSIPVAAAVFIALISPQWSFLDHISALVVSLFILHASWKIIRSSLDELADGGVPQTAKDRIHTLVKSANDVVSVHSIRARRLGPGIHVDLHIMVDGNMTVWEGHDISETVKQLLLDEGPDIIDVIVHLEACKGGSADSAPEKNRGN